MILVIGAAASGKREYVRFLGYTDEQVTDAALSIPSGCAGGISTDGVTAPASDGVTALAPDGVTAFVRDDTRPVLVNLHELVFAAPAAAPDLLELLLTRELVTCDEVGSGVIPGEPRARAAREASGRLCNQLAQQAEKVVRLVAGIPIVIKG
ncbi:MAG: bifunctional adenosylcobinamide kinase/adenosylcobinamide-phosphate guanylyltransferase [Coriobacteriales bacterium]|jgi:adenosyl cobinamide kinase/adenosyl cobinamide phosphate guanylyltransferase|nr:bifunctional adenosylcobinamide kinase/adenosylcobinamide-phosphate guanylyltransferase [Coriobacteriales bacterium]